MKSKKTKPKITPSSAVAKGSHVHAILALRPELESVQPASNVSYVDALVAEADLLAVNAAKYRAELVAVGTDPECIDSLAARSAAVKGATTLMRRNARGKGSDEIAMDERAIVHVSNMMAIGRFAMRNNPESQRVLDGIAEGTGPDDRLADLRDLADFFTVNAEAIGKTGENAHALAKEALELEAHLSALLRDRRLRAAESTVDTDMRDRAVAHLVAGMREVRAGGTFAFRADPAKALFFRAMLPRRPAKKKPAAPSPTPE